MYLHYGGRIFIVLGIYLHYGGRLPSDRSLIFIDIRYKTGHMAGLLLGRAPSVVEICLAKVANLPSVVQIACVRSG